MLLQPEITNTQADFCLIFSKIPETLGKLLHKQTATFGQYFWRVWSNLVLRKFGAACGGSKDVWLRLAEAFC